ncbi:MAG: PilT/PilU family type 4a pilus ATPase [bacterium]
MTKPADRPPTTGSFNWAKANMQQLLRHMVGKGATDLHLSAGAPPYLRVRTGLQTMATPPVPADVVQSMIYQVLTTQQRATFEEMDELDAGIRFETPPPLRFRINVHRERGAVGCVIRHIPTKIPSLNELRMPPIVKQLAGLKDGLVMVTGPTGHGKSTTQAAMIAHINETRFCSIVTIEDPIEYLHPNKKALVIQREVGADTKSFQSALRHTLRQDPDVILIGEMRDLETVRSVIRLAETGHLVISTFHSTTAREAIESMIGIFPAEYQNQVRMQLSSSLRGIIVQRLLPTADDSGVVPALEVLVATNAVRNLVMQGHLNQLQSSIETGSQDGMMSFDAHLRQLLDRGQITPEIARANARDPKKFA